MQLKYTSPEKKFITIMPYYKTLLGLRIDEELYVFLANK